jgi:hypothetical protein
MPTQPTLIVEFAPDNGALDATLTWIDITVDVVSINTQRGRGREGGPFQAGTATVVLDNEDGTYTPGNSHSTYYNRLLPICPIRIRATWSATTYDVYYGFIERFVPDWPGGLRSTVQCECVDAFALLARQKWTQPLAASGTGQRMRSLFAGLAWPIYVWNGIALTYYVFVPAITLTQVAVLSHMQAVELTEGGQFWMQADGGARWQWRDARITDARSVYVQARFGYDPLPTIAWTLGDSVLSVLGTTTIPRNTSFPGQQELPYLHVQMSLDDTTVTNDAQLTDLSGAIYTASDAASQARYGVHTYTASYLADSVPDTQNRATAKVAAEKDARLRIPQINLSGHQDDNTWLYVLYLDISDRVVVVVRHGTDGAVGQNCFIESVAHSITDSTWETTYSLSPAPV